jgi:small subunit ribosomal protein S16
MAVKIRLARAGARNRPYYRIVVADTRAPRDGKFIELVGTYDPVAKPAKVTVKGERVAHWVGLGAKPTRTVSQLMSQMKKTEAAQVTES